MIATCQRVRDLAPGFVLGALEPEEMLAVREHLEECDKPHPEITELGGVVPYLSQLVEPVEPAASVKAAILTAARADLAARSRRDQAAERLVAALGSAGPRRKPAPPSEPEPAAEPAAVPAAPVEFPSPEPAPERAAVGANVVSIDAARARRNRILRAIVGVAAAIAVVFGAGAYIDLQNKYADLKQAVESVYPGGPADKAHVTLRPPSSGTAKGSGWVLPNGHLELALIDLPTAGRDEVYEVWLVADDGTATSGGFTNGGTLASVSIASPAVQTAGQVWVTLEHGRDARTPTLPAVLTGRIGS